MAVDIKDIVSIKIRRFSGLEEHMHHTLSQLTIPVGHAPPGSLAERLQNEAQVFLEAAGSLARVDHVEVHVDHQYALNPSARAAGVSPRMNVEIVFGRACRGCGRSDLDSPRTQTALGPACDVCLAVHSWDVVEALEGSDG